jgi:peptide-methionine (S)-S-oxide reductase
MNKVETAVFGGGCFWCTEAVFGMFRGVLKVTPGYAGGHSKNPTYEQVSEGNTGHAEVVQIEFDSEVISYTDLLTVFFASHDPTTLHRQGADIGSQYRSIILATNAKQKKEAEEFVASLNASSREGNPIVTEIHTLETWYPAEDYHKNYYETHSDAPYCEVVINPKLQKIQRQFSKLLQDKKH